MQCIIENNGIPRLKHFDNTSAFILIVNTNYQLNKMNKINLNNSNHYITLMVTEHIV